MAFHMVLYGACALVLFVVLAYYGWKTINAIWVEPHAIRKAFLKQGIPCLPYRLLVGNLTDIHRKVEAAKSKPMSLGCHNELRRRVFPFYYEWRESYGDMFVWWSGYQATLGVNKPDYIKDILYNKFGHFKKRSVPPQVKDWCGDSLVSLEGDEWAQHRRIVSPAFFIDKLKGMAPAMAACVDEMLSNWESDLDQFGRKEVDVHQQFKILTGDIIAHTAFGSSYEAGKLVFKHQQEQIVLIQKVSASIYIPGFRFLPTPSNRRLKVLKKTIEDTLMQIIKDRMDDCTTNDLLGILLAANRKELTGTQKNLSLDMQAIIDECKTFFFAGHETTATLMTWTIMLMASNDEWQEKARKEVLQFCGDKCPTYDSVTNLKLVGMVLNEALRLYPPAAALRRQTTKEMKLGDITLPSNTMLFMPIIDLHYDPAFWGPDAHEFNPQRFANGIASACKNPLAFFPFSMGPRNCVGQNFALLEARIILAMMLQRFQFWLSPGYIHCPIAVVTVQPKHGMQIVFEKLL